MPDVALWHGTNNRWMRSVKFALDLQAGGLEKILYILAFIKVDEAARRPRAAGDNGQAAANLPGGEALHIVEDSEDEMTPPPSAWAGYASDLYSVLRKIKPLHLKTQLDLSKGHLEWYMLLESYADMKTIIPLV